MDSLLESLRKERGREDAEIEAFVESCVSYETNVSFSDFTSPWPEDPHAPADDDDVSVVLLLGSEKDLEKTQEVAAVFPHIQGQALADAVRRAPLNAIYVAQIQPQARVLVGKVEATASRHNCPARPDRMHKMIQSAMKEASARRGLEVYYVGPAAYALCVAAVVARAGGRSFSAKAGHAARAYAKALPPIRVRLARPPTWSYPALAIVATSVQLCQRLTDAPTNLLDSLAFAAIALGWVRRLRGAAGDGVGVDADVICGDALRERGYGGLYGTGIVYDSGGLSLKSRDGMVGMKRDMAGAAAVLGAFVAMVRLGLPRPVTGLLCVAENALGPGAQRNDDIVTLRSGVTVEINNTDAEGRLVLADGVYHASAGLGERPGVIVDLATLTGAQAMATGTYHAAIYANDADAEQRFVQAGRVSGDLCFPVLYCPELHNGELNSEFADYRNSVENRMNAQVSCAAQFVGNNLAKDYEGQWVHVDLAAPATYDQATGFGVALLLQAFVPE